MPLWGFLKPIKTWKLETWQKHSYIPFKPPLKRKILLTTWFSFKSIFSKGVNILRIIATAVCLNTFWCLSLLFLLNLNFLKHEELANDNSMKIAEIYINIYMIKGPSVFISLSVRLSVCVCVSFHALYVTYFIHARKSLFRLHLCVAWCLEHFLSGGFIL